MLRYADTDAYAITTWTSFSVLSLSHSNNLSANYWYTLTIIRKVSYLNNFNFIVIQCIALLLIALRIISSHDFVTCSTFLFYRCNTYVTSHIIQYIMHDILSYHITSRHIMSCPTISSLYTFHINNYILLLLLFKVAQSVIQWATNTGVVVRKPTVSIASASQAVSGQIWI